MQFNLKGLVTIKKYEWNPDTNEYDILVEEREEENLMLRRVYEQAYKFNNVFSDDVEKPNLRVVLASDTATEVFDRSDLNGFVFATGDPTLVATPYTRTFTGEVGNSLNASNVVYNQRFVAPSTTRVIESIGISESVGLITDTTGGNAGSLYTYLKLTSSITQTNSQLLDLNYKVLIDWDTSVITGIPTAIVKAFEAALLGVDFNGTNKVIDPSGVLTGYLDHSGRDFAFLFYNDFTSHLNSALNHRLITTDTDDNELALGQTGGASLDLNATSGFTWLGRFVCHYLKGGDPYSQDDLENTFDPPSDTTGYLLRFNFGKTTDVGSVTSHASDSTLAVYDANKLANSSWQPVITETSPQPDFPSYYILKVVLAGGVGVGTYKVYKAGWGGWRQGLWAGHCLDPFLNFTTAYKFTDTYVSDNYDFYNARWVYKYTESFGSVTFVSYDRTRGVGLYTLTDRDLVLDDSWATGAGGLGTIIYDIAVDFANTLIYVAMDNGLHTINTSTSAINTLNGDKCLAVCVGNSSNAFGAFDDGVGGGRLSGSIGATWSTALSVGSPSPAITWANIWRLFIDPDSTNYEMMIVEGVTPKGTPIAITTSLQTIVIYRWWDNVSGVVSTTEIQDSGGINNKVISDLGMYGYNNSVLAKNGVWVYPTDFYLLRSGQDYSDYFPESTAAKDLIDDLLPLYSQIDWGNPLVGGITPTFTATPQIFTGGGSLLIGSGYLYLYRKHATGFFNDTPLVEAECPAECLGDWVKPKLGVDGSVYDVLYSVANTIVDNNVTWDVFRNQSHIVDSQASSPTTNQSIPFSNGLNYSAVRRVPTIYKVNIDTSGAPIGVLTDYSDLTTEQTYSLQPEDAQIAVNTITLQDKRLLYFYPSHTNKFGYTGFAMLNPMHRPDLDLDDVILQAWSWNGASWVDDPLNTGAGKPLHTSTDVLVDGLSIAWQDLQPGNSKDLIADQYYIFTRTTTPNMVPIEDHTPPVDIKFSLSLREPVTGQQTYNSINTSTPIYLPEAPLGNTPDSLYFSAAEVADGEDQISATLDAVEVPVTVNNSTSSPPAGQVRIRFNGEIKFNSAENGKTLILDYAYVRKYDTTETALS